MQINLKWDSKRIWRRWLLVFFICGRNNTHEVSVSSHYLLRILVPASCNTCAMLNGQCRQYVQRRGRHISPRVSLLKEDNLPRTCSAAPAGEPCFMKNKLFSVSSHPFAIVCVSSVCLWVHRHRRICSFDPAALLCPFIWSLTSEAAANPSYTRAHTLCD